MSRKDKDEREELIEELLGEVVELRARIAELIRPDAPVVDLASRRR
ncbi:hypothetical protein SAMN05421505_1628 [Sinosporangium album]|uniref:Uncharacterized protein n=1 Tax=Sinosporangium album TaxID=504805 RepID=A0A1G8L6H1_9ACTN|nr:hypothetical protein [Sinosporangium album]SDI51191.1 hypothetical protein SAMN05421505_1628 [Sinosporangium album]